MLFLVKLKIGHRDRVRELVGDVGAMQDARFKMQDEGFKIKMGR